MFAGLWGTGGIGKRWVQGLPLAAALTDAGGHIIVTSVAGATWLGGSESALAALQKHLPDDRDSRVALAMLRGAVSEGMVADTVVHLAQDRTAMLRVVVVPFDKNRLWLLLPPTEGAMAWQALLDALPFGLQAISPAGEVFSTPLLDTIELPWPEKPSAIELRHPDQTIAGRGAQVLDVSGHALGAWFIPDRLLTASAPQGASLIDGLVIDAAPLGVLLCDKTGVISAANQRLATWLGVAQDHLVGSKVSDWVAAEDKAKILEALALDDSPTDPLEVRLPHAQERMAHCFISQLEQNSLVAPRLIYVVDITQQKSLETQFAQSQKMQAVGQLAGGIAHDFNNLLTAMIGFCDLLLLRHKPGDQSYAEAMQIKQNANRAANLVRQLLAFSRQQRLMPKVLNLVDALAELSHLLRRLIGASITLDVNHARDLGLIKVDQGQLEQVLINLAVNARDAMANGGQLTVRTYNAVINQPVVRGEETIPAGDYVVIEVQDTGTGMPPEIIKRIFEPFFTTKGVGAGTGLGLSTVLGIIKQTGGYITVDSELGKGTRFHLYFPRYTGPVEAAAPVVKDKPAGVELTGRGRILLVEDEDPVRMFAAQALKNKGYTITEANCGEQALELLQNSGSSFDLMITDVVMPRMDGPTLIKTMRPQFPHLPVICVSGYTEDSLRAKLDDLKDIHFLPKPFSLKQLAEKVKSLLS